jgi:hypothetical protein
LTQAEISTILDALDNTLKEKEMENYPVRGFKNLIGETIKKINSKAINVIEVECVSGKIFEIDCDEQHYQIGIIRCTEKVER